MKKSLLAIAILAAFSAHAAVVGPDNVNTNTAAANQGQTQGMAQGQNQGQLQGQAQGQNQGQGQIATGGTAVSGAAAGAISGAAAGSTSGSKSLSSTGPVNASSTNSVGQNTSMSVSMTTNEAAGPTRVENVQSGTYNVRTTPDVYAPTMGTTAICVIGVSAGGSGLGWGFAVGSGVKDEGCEVRALSQLLPADAAKELLCAYDQRVAAAYKAVGKPCKSAAPDVKKAEVAKSSDMIAQYRN